MKTIIKKMTFLKIDGDHNFTQAQFNETHPYRSKKEKK